eukprot:XP_002257624.1 [Plasmodium knowlesi strain H]
MNFRGAGIRLNGYVCKGARIFELGTGVIFNCLYGGEKGKTSLYIDKTGKLVQCECKISPLVETSKFEQGLLKYSDINIHAQIIQKVNSNTFLNIEDYERLPETITSNIIVEEKVNIMYSTHIIRLNIKKNFENESSLINYIKQFYTKR